MTEEFRDLVPRDSEAAAEIGFVVPEQYNASEVLFSNLAAGRGKRIALRSDAGDVTYDALARWSCRIGNGLKSLGLEAGDRILFLLDDTPAYPAAFFGAVRAGLIPMLINTLSTPELLRFYVEDSGARAAIVEAEHGALFGDALRRGTELRSIITMNGEHGSHLAGDGWFDGFSEDLPCAPTGRDDMAFWMYSSGSTGRPKGVVHLQHDMAYTAASYERGVLRLTEDDICFSVPKIFFAYGFGNSITFPFSVGASAVLMSGRPVPGAVFEQLQRHRPTVFFGLPTLYTALIADPGADTADLGSLRLCISAAEILSREVFERWRDAFGQEIVEGLGSTEALHIYLSNREDSKRLGSAGQRVPGYQVKLTDGEGRPVGAGEEGVLWVRGDSNAPCYWNRPDKTEETMREGWIWTGDRFRLDDDGFYYFAGRADDLIKVSGQWVYPVEIERCLAEHPMVRECAVIGVEQSDRRMTIKAFVVLKEPAQGNDELTGALQAYVKERLLPFKYPRTITYLAELPKTGTGKLDRVSLANREANP